MVRWLAATLWASELQGLSSHVQSAGSHAPSAGCIVFPLAFLELCEAQGADK